MNSAAIRLLAMAGVGALASCAASAADWQLVSVSGQGKSYYVDVDSVRPGSDDHVRAWTKTTQKKGAAYRLAQLEWDCKARTFMIVVVVVYDGRGHSNTSVEPRPVFLPVPPESVADNVADFICRPK